MQPQPSSGCGGLPVYPSGYPAACQAALDAECCTWQEACSARPACVALVACINQCPSPRQDACITACSLGDAAAPGDKELEAIVTCAKGAALPAGCSWPK